MKKFGKTHEAMIELASKLEDWRVVFVACNGYDQAHKVISMLPDYFEDHFNASIEVVRKKGEDPIVSGVRFKRKLNTV